MVKYTIIIGSDSLGRLIKLLLKERVSRGAKAMVGAERIERRVLPSVLDSFVKKLADLIKLVISGDERSWLYPPKLFVEEGQLADEIKLEFEAKAGLLREITKFLNGIISSDYVDIDVRDIKARNIVVIRLKVSPNVLGIENIPEFQLENSNKTYLANLLKTGFERSRQFGAKEVIREVKETIKPSSPIEPPKPPREEVAHVSEVERIANRLQAEETYLFKESGRPDASFKVFAHSAGKFDSGICYLGINESELKEFIHELRGKNIDFWWFTSDFSQSKTRRGGKYNVSAGNLGSPGQEGGIYTRIIQQLEAHKGTVILMQADPLLKSSVKPTPAEIMNFIKQLSRKIRGEKATLIIVFTIPALTDDAKLLLSEIEQTLPKSNIIEL